MMSEEAETITIPRKKAQAASITVHLTFQDAPVDINFIDADIAAIERIITNTLARSGWKAARPAGGFPPRKPQTPPYYDGDGTACCPHHRVPLRHKEWGEACPQKLDPSDPLANSKGWCKYVWKEK